MSKKQKCSRLHAISFSIVQNLKHSQHQIAFFKRLHTISIFFYPKMFVFALGTRGDFCTTFHHFVAEIEFSCGGCALRHPRRCTPSTRKRDFCNKVLEGSAKIDPQDQPRAQRWSQDGPKVHTVSHLRGVSAPECRF